MSELLGEIKKFAYLSCIFLYFMPCKYFNTNQSILFDFQLKLLDEMR